MDITANLNLPYIMAAQAQKHVTHNEAIRALDALVMLAVMDRDLATPPASPDEGDRYLVAASATGAWSGNDGQIAAYQDGAWIFHTPKTGWTCQIIDEGILQSYDGANWGDIIGSELQNLSLLGINATADTTNKLSVRTDAVLFSNAGAGIQAKLNKNAVGDTASLLFQDNWSGRAEIGLTGDNNFHFKTSADGSTWYENITIDATNNRVGIGTDSPAKGLEINSSTGFRLSHPSSPTGYFTDFVQQWDSNEPFYSYVNNKGRVLGFKNLGDGAFSNSALHFSSYYGVFWETEGTYRAGITQAGDFGIGTTSPTCKLHVDGPVRTGSYTITTLPGAATVGEGAMIYVSDESGGAVMAFSDGTNWRRMTDRAVVS